MLRSRSCKSNTCTRHGRKLGGRSCLCSCFVRARLHSASRHLLSIDITPTSCFQFLKNPLYHFAWLLPVHLSLSHPLGDAHSLVIWQPFWIQRYPRSRGHEQSHRCPLSCPADIDHQNHTETSHLRRVRLETDLNAQLLAFRRLATRTLCVKRIEHVVDIDHYKNHISTGKITPSLPIPKHSFQNQSRTYKSTSQAPRSSPGTSPAACRSSSSRAGAAWHRSI
jgi:hypothetical protein